MKTISQDEWMNKHDDFKGINSKDVVPHILDNENGMTVSIPVQVEMPEFRKMRNTRFLKRGAPYMLNGQKVYIQYVYDNGIIKVWDKENQQSEQVLYCELEEYQRPYFKGNHIMNKPMPGDLLTEVSTGKKAVVESSMFEEWEGQTFVCFGFMAPFCNRTDEQGRAILSISGGPCRTIDTGNLQLDGTAELTCWNWGNNVPGANQGVRYKAEVKHFKYST